MEAQLVVSIQHVIKPIRVGSYLRSISYVENIRPTHISFAVIFTSFLLTYTLVEIRKKVLCFTH
nr:MAG TPA: hypothetical protein [Caudoviricetes sp.]